MTAQIHPTAVIDRSARVGEDVTIGANVVIGPSVEIGDRTVVQPFCMLGTTGVERLEIGADSIVRSHTVIYSGTTIGSQLETGHHVSIREGMTIGANLRVGTNSDLQGHGTVGDYVRIHSGVFVPHFTTIGDFVWLFPHVVLTNDPHPPSDDYTAGPTIGRCAVVGARALILPGVNVGADAVVAAGATVTRDVEAGRLVVGAPARDVGPADQVRWRDRSRPGSPYPWWKHFSRGYPVDVSFEGDPSSMF